MLEGEPDLTLSLLNTATLAWVELEYQRRTHSEIQQTPLDRWLEGPSASRPCPSLDELRLAFTVSKTVSLRQACMTAGETTGSVGCLTIHRRRTTDEARIAPHVARHSE
jgi:hypothetical protein